MTCEIETTWFKASKQGKAFVLDLLKPHLVLSTSQINGGLKREIEHLMNLQTCEGKYHDDIAKQPLHLRSEKEHFSDAAKKLNLSPEKCAFMGTAANMNYCQMGKETFQDLEVHAFATAGVQANATRAGDPAKYYEHDGTWKPCQPKSGTINIMLHINHPLSEAAITRAAMTLTEAKTAVMMDLGVGSLSSPTLATGTGTDQFIIAASLNDHVTPLTWSGAHTKLGECIGKAVYTAVRSTLEWQNGLDVKRCRGLYHQLKRFGFKPEDWLNWLKPYLKEKEHNFFEANRLAIEHDLYVSNCVAAITQLLDRSRCGHITQDSAIEQSRSLCALMVVQLAEDDSRYEEVLQELQSIKDPFSQLAQAIVLAWRKKWS